MNEELFSIGEFSKICSVSIQALRYYDKIGLLKPKFTRYRFYGAEQIVVIKIIQKMVTLGLSLSEISVFLDRNDMVGIKSILEEKRQEIEEKINELLYAKKGLELHINNINLKDSTNFSCIEIKKLSSRHVIYLRKMVELNENGFTKLFNEFEKMIRMQKYSTIGNPMAIFYGERILGNVCDIELCIEIEKSCVLEDNYKIIQGGYYLTKMHLGAHLNKPATYGILRKYADKNNICIVGNAVEVYYVDISITKNVDEFITEIQIPVKNMLTL